MSSSALVPRAHPAEGTAYKGSLHTMEVVASTAITLSSSGGYGIKGIS